MSKSLLWIGYALVALGACFSTWVLLYAGMPGTFREWLANIPWLGWISLPYVVMYFGLRIFRERSSLLIVTLIAVGLLTGMATCGFMDGFVLHPDAQSALLFIFIPLYQVLLFLPFLIVLMVVRWLIKRRASAV